MKRLGLIQEIALSLRGFPPLNWRGAGYWKPIRSRLYCGWHVERDFRYYRQFGFSLLKTMPNGWLFQISVWALKLELKLMPAEDGNAW